MKVAIAGTGYVGLLNVILLAQYNDVIVVDIVEEKVRQVNEWNSPITDADIEDYLYGEVKIEVGEILRNRNELIHLPIRVKCSPCQGQF